MSEFMVDSERRGGGDLQREFTRKFISLKKDVKNNGIIVVTISPYYVVVSSQSLSAQNQQSFQLYRIESHFMTAH